MGWEAGRLRHGLLACVSFIDEWLVGRYGVRLSATMVERNIIRVGTRGSELALWQANATEEKLRQAFPDVEIVRCVIKTTGDRRTDVALSEVAKSEGVIDKGVFIKELEMALASQEIDVAVHSLKDVPTVLADSFIIPATLERAGIRDVLVSKQPGGWQALPAGARVGTSSVRRARQLQWMRPDLQIIDLRGNVPTRLRKLRDAEDYDAIMLAEAGLARLGFLPNSDDRLFFEVMEEQVFYPAAGQGAIGLEVRSTDPWIKSVVESIGDNDTLLRVNAEREFLRLLDAGCHTPVGVYSALSEGQLSMSARVFPEAGGEPRLSSVQGSSVDAMELAKRLFETLV